MEFNDVAADYIAQPSPQRLRALRLAIQSRRSYTAAPPFLPRAAGLAAAGRHREVIELVGQWMPGAFLSPSAHSLLARSLAGLGDQEGARQERDLARLAALSLLRSGDGSQANPWVVLRIPDEYDLLRWRHRNPVGQRVVQGDAGRLDVITCDDGSEAWFQVFRDGRSVAGAAA